VVNNDEYICNNLLKVKGKGKVLHHKPHNCSCASYTGAAVQLRPQPIPVHSDSDPAAIQPYVRCVIIVSTPVIDVIKMLFQSNASSDRCYFSCGWCCFSCMSRKLTSLTALSYAVRSAMANPRIFCVTWERCIPAVEVRVADYTYYIYSFIFYLFIYLFIALMIFVYYARRQHSI